MRALAPNASSRIAAALPGLAGSGAGASSLLPITRVTRSAVGRYARERRQGRHRHQRRCGRTGLAQIRVQIPDWVHCTHHRRSPSRTVRLHSLPILAGMKRRREADTCKGRHGVARSATRKATVASGVAHGEPAPPLRTRMERTTACEPASRPTRIADPGVLTSRRRPSIGEERGSHHCYPARCSVPVAGRTLHDADARTKGRRGAGMAGSRRRVEQGCPRPSGWPHFRVTAAACRGQSRNPRPAGQALPRPADAAGAAMNPAS